METQTLINPRDIKTVSFREVHQDLENENLFLKQTHDIKSFKEKGDFLRSIGFNNSISTKIYSSLSENQKVINEYERKYHGIFKFILEPQLERICEKYNLYVRSLDLFLADIPEENIKHMMNFKVHIEDLDNSDRLIEVLDSLKLLHIIQNIGAPGDFNNYLPISLSDLTRALSLAKSRGFRIYNPLEIAAVESMFHEKAFASSRSRILDTAELSAKSQVDLDPIVLLKTKHGRIIITAWGDEANDETVLNNKLN